MYYVFDIFFDTAFVCLSMKVITPPSSAEDKNAWCCISTPHTFL
jgi:hypothetical protein